MNAEKTLHTATRLVKNLEDLRKQLKITLEILNQGIASAQITFKNIMGDERIMFNPWSKLWTNLLMDHCEARGYKFPKVETPREAVEKYIENLGEAGYVVAMEDFKIAEVENGLSIEVYTCPYILAGKIIISKLGEYIGCRRATTFIAAIERMCKQPPYPITYEVAPQLILGGNSCKIRIKWKNENCSSPSPSH